MNDIDQDIRKLFVDVKEDYIYDYGLEDAIVEVISRPKNYQVMLSKARIRRKVGAICSFILLLIYLCSLISYTSLRDELMVTILSSLVVIAVIGVLFSTINGTMKNELK